MTGDGDGDDESIFLELSQVESCVEAIAIVVNIYSGNKSFANDFSEAYVRVYDSQTDHVYCSYTLNDGSIKTNGIVFVMFKRGQHGEWEMQNMAQGCDGSTAKNTTTNLWDCDTRMQNKIDSCPKPPFKVGKPAPAPAPISRRTSHAAPNSNPSDDACCVLQ